MSRPKEQRSPLVDKSPRKIALMLLTNAYDPDPRVRQEVLALIRMGCRVRLLAWDRDVRCPQFESMEGVEVERVFLSSQHGRGNTQLLFYAWLYLKMLWRGWRIPFDLIHCHDLDTIPLGFVLGKLKGKPIVYDAHESFPDMLSGNVHLIMRRGVYWLEDFLIRRVGLLITVGEKLRRHFTVRGARRSVVVGNWKRLDEFSRSEDQILKTRQDLGYSVEAIRDALTALHDSHLRNTMTQNARRFGDVAMNWRKGEEILYLEYSALLPNGLNRPAASEEPSASFTAKAAANAESSF